MNDDAGSQPMNPFAPPQTDIATAGASVAETAQLSDLATRWQRLGGAMVDGIIYLVAVAPAYMAISFKALGEASRTHPSPFLIYQMAGKWGLVAGALTIALRLLNWTLLARRGQTIGKIAAGTRVVLVDGSRAPFGRVVVLRAWIHEALGLIPFLNKAIGAVGVVDALFVYRSDKRCLHDLVAGTKVVRAGVTPR